MEHHLNNTQNRVLRGVCYMIKKVFYIIILFLCLILTSTIYVIDTSNDLQYQIDSTNTRINVLVNKLESYKNNIPNVNYDDEISDLYNKVSNLHDEVSALYDEVSDLHSEVSDLYNKNSDSQNQTSDLHNQINGLYEKVSDLYEKINDLYEKVSDLYEKDKQDDVNQNDDDEQTGDETQGDDQKDETGSDDNKDVPIEPGESIYEDVSDLYYGRLYIEDLNINVALYCSAEQYITDRIDSANVYWTYNNKLIDLIIADHKNQAFANLSNAVVGTRGYIEHNFLGRVDIVCVDVFNGHNTGYYLVDENGKIIESKADYLMYTCRDNSYNIFVCLWDIV